MTPQEIGARMLQEKQCSLQWLQRTFGMKFREAVDLLNDFERMGIVSPFDGVVQRKLLVANETELTRKLEEL